MANIYLEKIAQQVDYLGVGHTKEAVSISSMMPSKPKVAIGIRSALARSGALTRARNAIPSSHFGSQAITKMAAKILPGDMGANPFGGRTIDPSAAGARVLPDAVHHAVDGVVGGVKGVGEIGRQGLHHLTGSKVRDHMLKHTDLTASGVKGLGADTLKAMLVDKPQHIPKLNTLLRLRTGTRALAGGAAVYGGYKLLTAPPKADQQYYDYGNY